MLCPPQRFIQHTFHSVVGSAAFVLVEESRVSYRTNAELSESNVSSDPRHSTRPWDFMPTPVMRPVMEASTADRSILTTSLCKLQ